MNAAYTAKLYLFKMSFYKSVLSTPRFFNWSLSLIFSCQTLYTSASSTSVFLILTELMQGKLICDGGSCQFVSLESAFGGRVKTGEVSVLILLISFQSKVDWNTHFSENLISFLTNVYKLENYIALYSRNIHFDCWEQKFILFFKELIYAWLHTDEPCCFVLYNFSRSFCTLPFSPLSLYTGLYV
jgi:hypothetical protein